MALSLFPVNHAPPTTMIITYPIQIPYTAGNQQRVMPDTMFNNSEILSGSFPMGKNRFWHGGVHVHPADRATPIRAIAEGELVAYRYDDNDAKDDFFDKVSYSRSFVLLKHDAELGQTALGKSTLTFYSLYMHLQAWSEVSGKSGSQAVNFLKKLVPSQPRLNKAGTPVLDKDKKPIMEKERVEHVPLIADGACHSGKGSMRVQRGDVIGYCGSVPDNLNNPSRGIHFEIFLEDVKFLDNACKVVWGRCNLIAPLTAHKELLTMDTFGVDPAKPLMVDDQDSPSGHKKVTVMKNVYWVSDEQISAKEVELPDPKHKKQMVRVTKYFANSKELRGYRKCPATNAVTLTTGTAFVPWLEPWLNIDEFRQEKVNEKTWIQIYVVESNKLYWVEKAEVKFRTDADWPNFQKIEEHASFSTDGFIDDDGLQKLFATLEKNHNDKDRKALADVQETLRCLITKHPTEWSRQNVASRFERVTQDAFGAAKLTTAQFGKLVTHIERLSFWEDVPGLPAASGIWHVHPIRFIEHLANCMWLSKNELALIYPGKTEYGDSVAHGTTDEIREKYRVEINKCCYKYGINSRLRQAHFFGQGAIESESLKSMLEKASGSNYEFNDALGNKQPGDGPKFKGRGFKQITGRYNYAEYWVYKGWLKKGRDFDIGWERDPKKRYPKIENPEALIGNAFNCIDAGCWYITIFRNGAVAAMDKDNIVAVTRAINGGENALAERTAFTKRIKKVTL